jgi:hypothetical protein
MTDAAGNTEARPPKNGRNGGEQKGCEDVTEDVGSIRSRGANEEIGKQGAGDVGDGRERTGVEEGGTG